MKFIDLFAGLGGFHRALEDLGYECAFVSEKNKELRDLYPKSFPDYTGPLVDDITLHESRGAVPGHDILCAGFPCQPFSKSGRQDGFKDLTRGTLFHEIVDILEKKQPEYIILENVGNFERHDGGRTWKIVKQALDELGYDVKGTEHRNSGGTGLISPHHLGYPHTRERFFIVGRLKTRGGLPERPFPDTTQHPSTALTAVVQPTEELSDRDRVETRLTDSHVKYIEHWNTFVKSIPEDVDLPSFPIWADELLVTYPFELKAPRAYSAEEIRRYLNLSDDEPFSKEEFLKGLPVYALRDENELPGWKQTFIRQNRQWLKQVRQHLADEWISVLRDFPHSHRKLEWNYKGGERDLWKHVLQFRPSGLRIKRYTAIPSLVAMTDTQIPILGPERRFLTPTEGLRLQGFPDEHHLPKSRAAAFAALGNAVHVEVVKAIAEHLLCAAEAGGGKSAVPPLTLDTRPVQLTLLEDRGQSAGSTPGGADWNGPLHSRHSEDPVPR